MVQEVKEILSESESGPQRETQKAGCAASSRFFKGAEKIRIHTVGMTCTGKGSARSDISFRPEELAITATLLRKINPAQRRQQPM